eukprot:997451-Amphidinium_carterae.1
MAKWRSHFGGSATVESLLQSTATLKTIMTSSDAFQSCGLADNEEFTTWIHSDSVKRACASSWET